MKYKIGDQVRVKSLKKLEEIRDHSPGVVDSMFEMAGKVVTIEGANYFTYRIKECGCNWTDNMFVGLVKDEKKGEVKMTKTARKVKKEFEAQIGEMEQDFKAQLKAKDEEMEEVQEELTKKDREFDKKTSKINFDHEMEIVELEQKHAKTIASKDLSGTKTIADKNETIARLNAKNGTLEEMINAIKKIGVSEVILAENSTLKAKVSGLEYTVEHITNLLEECRKNQDFSKVYDLIEKATKSTNAQTKNVIDAVGALIPDVKVVNEIVTPEDD